MYTTQNIFVLYYVYISVKEGIFMATKKAASTKKKTTAKKTAASKTTVRTVSAEKVEAPKKETAAAKPTTTKRSSVKLPSNKMCIRDSIAPARLPACRRQNGQSRPVRRPDR